MIRPQPTSRQIPVRVRRWRRFAAAGAAGIAMVVGLAFAADRLDKAYPPPLGDTLGRSVEVVDRNGQTLRVFAAADGRWRLPVDLARVDPQYLRLVIAYEDRRFYSHHGVDPWAMLRAAGQLLANGRIVSGGSTITMQLARLAETGDSAAESTELPRRSLLGKLRQIVRAIQIERRLSKDEILARYLTLAPYGGNIEGVRAASLAWFGKEPMRLTPAEAALLVALPQSPETATARPLSAGRRGSAQPHRGPASRGRRTWRQGRGRHFAHAGSADAPRDARTWRPPCRSRARPRSRKVALSDAARCGDPGAPGKTRQQCRPPHRSAGVAGNRHG